LQRLIDNPDLLATLRSGIRMPRGIDDEMLQLMEIYRHVVSAPPIALDSMTSEPSASYS
jgi:hypothetical protein